MRSLEHVSFAGVPAPRVFPPRASLPRAAALEPPADPLVLSIFSRAGPDPSAYPTRMLRRRVAPCAYRRDA